MSKMVEDVVTVKIELGHKADFKPKPSPEGFTHDWTVFVRGPDGTNIQHYVEKVVFHLHDTFKNPKRVVTEPPYAVSESGYAGFLLPIEIFFKNKHPPRKIRFEYDLYLNGEGAGPVDNKRYEKLKFSNPSEDFRQKLLKAGAVSSIASAANQPFMDLFGPPIKTNVDSPKKHKNKDKEKSYSKGKHSPATSNSSSTSEKESKVDSHFQAVGKDISNTSSALQKDKDGTFSVSQRDREGLSASSSSSASSKDRESTSSHKDTGVGSSSQRSSSSARDKEKDSFSSSHKEKETSMSHKDYKGGGSGISHRDKNGFKKSSSSSGHKEGAFSSTSSMSSSTSQGQKSSSSLHKSSHKDSSSVKAVSGKDTQANTEVGSVQKERSSEHKKKSKEKSSREKEAGESATKRASDMSAMSENSSSKKQKLDSKSSGSSKSKSKSEHEKTSSKDGGSKSSFKTEGSKPPIKREGKSENSTRLPGELDSRPSSTGSSKRKSVENRGTEDTDKKAGKSKHTSAPALMQRKLSSSSLSSDVSTESSLKFTDDEEEHPGLDISNLMADLGSPSDKEQNIKPKPKALSSPAPSSPVTVHSSSSSSRSKTSKTSSLSLPSKKKSPPSPNPQSPGFSNHTSISYSSKLAKSTALTSSSKKISPSLSSLSSSKSSRPPSSSTDKAKGKRTSSDSKEEGKVSKVSKSDKREGKIESPQAVPSLSRKESQNPGRLDKKKVENPVAQSKPLKVEKQSSEEEGELSSSSNLSESSDEELDKVPEVVLEDKSGNDMVVGRESATSQPDPSSVAALVRSTSLEGSRPVPHQNGGLFYKDDLADNGYTLWSLVLLQKEIEGVSDPSVLQEIAELVFDTGKFTAYDDTFEFDLCAMDRDLVDKIRDVVSHHHRNP